MRKKKSYNYNMVAVNRKQPWKEKKMKKMQKTGLGWLRSDFVDIRRSMKEDGEGKKMNTNKNLKKNEVKIEIDEMKKEDVIDNKIKEKWTRWEKAWR